MVELISTPGALPPIGSASASARSATWRSIP